MLPKKDISPIHPGEVLLEDFLNPLGITRYRLAKSIGVPQRRIDEICAGKRAITADTALRLARFFGTDSQSWLNLQSRYDLEVAGELLAERLDREVTPFNLPMRCPMSPSSSACAKELYHEIETTPEEYLPALLEIVRGFRHGIFLKPADESFRQGMKEALQGNTLPISELWKGIDAR